MWRGLALALTGLAVVACQPKDAPKSVVLNPPAEGAYKAEPQDLDAELAEEIRRGAVQASAASETIEEALNEARVVAAESPDESRDAATAIAEFLDSAGATVSDTAVEPPGVEAVKADFAKADDDRKARIGDLNDAYRDLLEAKGAADSLAVEDERFQALAGLIQFALDDTADAAAAFGGTIEDIPDSSGE